MTSQQPSPEHNHDLTNDDEAPTGNREFPLNSQQLENEIAGYNPNAPIQLEQEHQLLNHHNIGPIRHRGQNDWRH